VGLSFLEEKGLFENFPGFQVLATGPVSKICKVKRIGPSLVRLR
jgi:hypothetical protein